MSAIWGSFHESVGNCDQGRSPSSRRRRITSRRCAARCWRVQSDRVRMRTPKNLLVSRAGWDDITRHLAVGMGPLM